MSDRVAWASLSLYRPAGHGCNGFVFVIQFLVETLGGNDGGK